MNRLCIRVSLWILASLFIFTSCGEDSPEPAPTILTPTITGIFQPEGELKIAFDITGKFTEGNIFTAQLSDANGSFSSPTAIGTLTSVSAGTITAILPAGVANGSGYRIRVSASAPQTISPDNGSNLSIGAPTLTISSVSTSPEGLTYIAGRQISVTTAITGTFTTNNIFKIQLSDPSGSFENPTILLESASLSSISTVTLPQNLQVGSGYRLRVTSSSPAITGAASSAINVVALTFSAPAITGNVVLGGAATITVTINNGPLLSGNFKIQLSDVNGSFNTPTDLVVIQNPASSSHTSNVTLPANITPGSAYKLRAISTGPAYTGPSSSAFTIGSLPTITISEATPVFTRMYTAQTSGIAYNLFYNFTVQTTGSFNPNTSFILEAASGGQSFGAVTITYNGLTAATLAANGTVTAYVGLRSFPEGVGKFRVRANGHAVISNEKTYNVSQTTLSSVTASVDNINYNFGTNKSLGNNTTSYVNNKGVSLMADAAYNLNGASSMRVSIGVSLTNEVVTTGTKTISITMNLLSANGAVLASYSNANVSSTITGTATDGFTGTIGNITLTKFGTGTGPATLTMQSGSYTFSME